MPIFTEFGTKHIWVDGNQINFTNEGLHPSWRGDNSKKINIYGDYLKIFYLRTTGLVSTKLGINHPWRNSYFFKNKEPWPSTRGVYS